MAENETKDFIDALAQGKNDDAGEAFKNALRGKVGDALDAERKKMAANMFNTAEAIPSEAEPYSDPKPEIAEPGSFDREGNVIDSKDGQAEIDLSADETK